MAKLEIEGAAIDQARRVLGQFAMPFSIFDSLN